MANAQIPTTSAHYGQCTGIAGKDASNNTQALSSLTATIDDYASAYVTKASPGDGVGFYIVPKAPLGVGIIKTVNVTIQGKSLDGTALPAVVVSADLLGAPAPPQAQTVAVGGVSVWGGTPSTTTNPDPGSATAVII